MFFRLLICTFVLISYAISSLLAIALPPSTFSSRAPSLLPTHQLYQFPLGTWVENLAVRSNNNLLLTILTSPSLYTLNPLFPATPTLVYNFPTLSLTGIAETSPDIFAVGAGNFSITTGQLTPGSWSVWRVDMRGIEICSDGSLTAPPVVSKIADVPEVVLLNGMTLLSERAGTVLFADSTNGVVYRLDVNTGVYALVLSDPLMAGAQPPTPSVIGINGLHVRDSTLFFTNTAKGVYARLPINEDGTPAGSSSVVCMAEAGDSYDDFALGKDGEAFLVTGSGNSVVMEVGGTQVVLAGNLNSTEIAEPTSAKLGRGGGKGMLYVTTAGGLAIPVDGTERVGAQVIAVDLPGR